MPQAASWNALRMKPWYKPSSSNQLPGFASMACRTTRPRRPGRDRHRSTGWELSLAGPRIGREREHSRGPDCRPCPLCPPSGLRGAAPGFGSQTTAGADQPMEGEASLTSHGCCRSSKPDPSH